jgi:mycofactocin system glycosyltransferase
MMVSTGFAHPVPPPGAGPAPDAVTLVVPVKDGADLLPGSVAAAGVAKVVVVDDGSTDGTATVASRLGASVVHHERSLGPAAARNAGLARVATPFALFVDADAILRPSWRLALAHFADPAVGAVLPRIVAPTRERGAGLVERYVAARSPYDLGPAGCRVERGTRRPSAGTGAFLARVAALRDVGGFDPTMRYGEDVELYWSLADAGWTVRYEPAAEAEHPARAGLGDLLREHCRYGTPAALLAARHGHRSGGAIAGSTLAAAGLLAMRRGRWAGVGLAAATGTVAARLTGAGVPPVEAAKLAVRWQVRSARTLAAVSSGAAAPLGMLAALANRRARWLVGGAWLARHLQGWRAAAPEMGPLPWVALATADDAALTAGIWKGIARERHLGPVTPAWSRPFAPSSVTEIPGWTTLAVFP